MDTLKLPPGAEIFLRRFDNLSRDDKTECVLADGIVTKVELADCLRWADPDYNEWQPVLMIALEKKLLGKLWDEMARRQRRGTRYKNPFVTQPSRPVYRHHSKSHCRS